MPNQKQMLADHVEPMPNVDRFSQNLVLRVVMLNAQLHYQKISSLVILEVQSVTVW